VLLVPRIEGRVESSTPLVQAVAWASILPATWSFMLAARARGLGTSWTSLHLAYEREAAEVLGIPYDEVQQTALIPVAHTMEPTSSRHRGSHGASTSTGSTGSRRGY
jgi:nitroreductase